MGSLSKRSSRDRHLCYSTGVGNLIQRHIAGALNDARWLREAAEESFDLRVFVIPHPIPCGAVQKSKAIEHS
jgi:hypothetical protein